MGSKKKKKSDSHESDHEKNLENITPDDLSQAKHIQLIPIEASESISEFVKEFREIFMPKFKQMEEENSKLKRETQSLKLQLHNALGKIEILGQNHLLIDFVKTNFP